MLRIVKGVKCALPQVVLKEERKNAPAYADQKMHENEAYLLNGSLWLTGVVEDKLFIVLTPYGETGYMPQEWFFEENG